MSDMSNPPEPSPKVPRLQVLSGERVELERELLRATLTLEQNPERFAQLLRRVTPAANIELELASDRKEEW
jgi:hypothetical protein